MARMVAVGASRVRPRLREFPRCASCGRRILGVMDGGPGVAVARENGVRSCGQGAFPIRRHATFHPDCLAARVRCHQRHARCILTVTCAGALAAAIGLWWAGITLLPAVLLACLGAYAAHLEASDISAEVTEPHSATAPINLRMV